MIGSNSRNSYFQKSNLYINKTASLNQNTGILNFMFDRQYCKKYLNITLSKFIEITIFFMIDFIVLVWIARISLIWQIIWHQYLELKKTKSTAHFISRLVLVDMVTDAQEFTINQLLVKQLCYKIYTSILRTQPNLLMDHIWLMWVMKRCRSVQNEFINNFYIRVQSFCLWI